MTWAWFLSTWGRLWHPTARASVTSISHLSSCPTCPSGAVSPHCTLTCSSAVQEKCWGDWPQPKRRCQLLGWKKYELWMPGLHWNCESSSPPRLQPRVPLLRLLCQVSWTSPVLNIPAAVYSFPACLLVSVGASLPSAYSWVLLQNLGALKASGVTVSAGMHKWLCASGI